jgi:acyl-CoA thioesterase
MGILHDRTVRRARSIRDAPGSEVFGGVVVASAYVKLLKQVEATGSLSPTIPAPNPPTKGVPLI